MTTDSRGPSALTPAPARSLLRAAFRRPSASTTGRDVVRELPGYPVAGRAGLAGSLLAGDRRHVAFV